jgi:hypothetical protein
MIRLVCPNLGCRKILAVPETTRGRVIRCGQCGKTIKVPEGKKPPAPKPAAAEKT